MLPNMRVLPLIAICITLGASAWAANTEIGHDPVEVSAVPYPNPSALDLALEQINTQVRSSQYPSQLNNELINEIDELRANAGFLYIPTIMVIEPSLSNSQGERFVNLAARTRSKKGAPIHLSERTLSYETKQLAHLLLHELLHHVLSIDVALDELFVEKLAESMSLGTHSKLLEIGVSKSLVIRDDYFSAAGLYRRLLAEAVREHPTLFSKAPAGWLTTPPATEVEIQAIIRRGIALPGNLNLSNRTIDSVAKDFTTGLFEIMNPDRLAVHSKDDRDAIFRDIEAKTRIRIEQLAKGINSGNHWFSVSKRAPGCKKRRSPVLFGWDECQDQLLFKDLFVANQIEAP